MGHVGDLAGVFFHIVVGEQREWAGFTGPMTVGAVVIDDRRNIVRKRHSGLQRGAKKNESQRIPAIYFSTSASEHPTARVSGLLRLFSGQHRVDRVVEFMGGRHGTRAAGVQPKIVDAAVIDQYAFRVEHCGFGRGGGMGPLHQFMVRIAQSRGARKPVSIPLLLDFFRWIRMDLG